MYFVLKCDSIQQRQAQKNVQSWYLCHNLPHDLKASYHLVKLEQIHSN